MRSIQFDTRTEGGLNLYHYVPGEQLPVDRHWPGLWEQPWPEYPTPTPWTEWAVNNSNCEEIAIYLGLVWRLTEGRQRFGIPVWDRDTAARNLDREPTLVDWQFEVDTETPDARTRAEGLVPGRVAVPQRFVPDRNGLLYGVPDPDAHQRQHQHHAGLFDLQRPQDLVGLLHATLSDASAEVSMFAVSAGPQREVTLIDSLRGPHHPSLAGILLPGDIFVHMAIGVDPGHYDSIMLASHDDLTPQLRELTRDLQQRISRYEAGIGQIPDVSAFLAAMPNLTGLPPRS